MTTSVMEKVIACPTLPSLPGVALRVLELTRDPNVRMADIADAVHTDPALTAKVLRTINSSYYGLSQPCPSIPRAMSMLGLKAVKSIVLGFSLVDYSRSATKGGHFDLQTYFRRGLYSAAAARAIAMHTGACDAEEAFVGALIADIGMLAMFASLKHEYQAAIEGAPEDHDDLAAIESRVFGFDHAELGGELGKRWKFPEQLTECIRWHQAPERCRPQHDKLLKIVRLGNLVAGVLSLADPRRKLGAFIVSGRDWLQLDREAARSLIETSSRGAAELAKSLEIRTGDRPDTAAILAQAQEQMLAQQIEMQAENRELERKSVTDALTGAHNRAFFDATMQERFDQARASGKPLTVIFSDADKFKLVNDNHGHQAGDAVLKELARRLRDVIGNGGYVCRYGGEEFAVILPGLGAPKAAKVGELLRSVIAGKPFDLSPHGVPLALPITISLGVCSMEGPSAVKFPTPDALVCAADQCVYSAKRAGRNRVVVWEPGAASAEAANARSSATPLMERRVLIIEDDPLAAKLLNLLFSRKLACVCECVDSGEKALEWLDSERAHRRPDLAVVDYHLPGIGGADLIQELRRRVGNGPTTILVISSTMDAATRAASLAAGAPLVLDKTELCADFDKAFERIQHALQQSAAKAA